MHRWELTKQRPRTAPPGYREGVDEAVELLRREMRGYECVRDELGNPVIRQTVDFGTALAKLKRERPAWWGALKEFSEEVCPEAPGDYVAMLIGDPGFSDIDTVGDLRGIPIVK